MIDRIATGAESPTPRGAACLHRAAAVAVSMGLLLLMPAPALAQQSCRVGVQAPNGLSAGGTGLQWPAAGPSASAPDAGPVFGSAERVRVQRAANGRRQAILEGDAQMRRADTRLRAEHLAYDELTGQVQAEGAVDLQRADGTRIQAPSAHFNLQGDTGSFEAPRYGTARGQGRAARVDVTGPRRYRLKDATFSSCAADSEDWVIRAEELDLDQDASEGRGRWATVRFKDVPLITLPVFWFPLDDQRRSGLLPPTLTATSRGGLELSVPYYFNLAPNYDLTVTPQLSWQRGLQVVSDGRYLFRHFRGSLRHEWVPRDAETRTNSRYYVRAVNSLVDIGGWSGGWDVAGVSDDNYFVDYSRTLDGAALRSLPRDFWLGRTFGAWNLGLRATRYQNILDARLAPPYERLPQVSLSTYQSLPGGLEMGFYSNATVFRRPLAGSAEGLRLQMQPSVSYPIQGAGWFVTPRVQLNMASYEVEGLATGPRSLMRAIPTASLDAGMVLERNIEIAGRERIQTLEPRLFYVNTPYQDQSDYPVYDTAPLDFGYPQLLTENAFSGMDRIADANHLTAALFSRFMDQDSGVERLRVGLAQRFYFRPQRVELPGVAPLNDRRSDLLLMLSGRLGRDTLFDGGMQFALRDKRMPRYSMMVRHHGADARRLLNLGVRFQADTFGQWDASFQWPLGRRWNLLGKINYSFLGTSASSAGAQFQPGLVEGVLGAEYRACCWAARVVAQRFVTAAGQFTNTLYFQLDLLGLGRVGSDPFGILLRTIPGYRVPDVRAAGEWQAP